MHGAADTGSGLLTNVNGQVVHLNGEPIAGLYAAPNVAARTAVGLGYSSGQVLAQAMTFSYLGIAHATGGVST